MPIAKYIIKYQILYQPDKLLRYKYLMGSKGVSILFKICLALCCMFGCIHDNNQISNPYWNV